MGPYLIGRLAQFVPVLVGASLAVFAIMHVLPGDVAVLIAVGPEGKGSATPQQLAAIRRDLQLDRPLPEQYLAWVSGMLRLDAGYSLRTKKPVFEEIRNRAPLTLEIAAFTTLISLLIALPVGVVSAVKRNTLLDYLLRAFSIGGLAMPTFWTGLLVILTLVSYFRWLPPLGYRNLWEDPAKNLLQVIWPCLALGYAFSAMTSRMVRSAMLEVLAHDYVRTARAKGLREWFVVNRHALRNALLPVVTLVGLQFSFLLGGTVVQENLFNLPGLGRMLIEAINYRDYPAVQALVMVFALTILGVNLIVDLTYGWLDPRIRYGGRG